MTKPSGKVTCVVILLLLCVVSPAGLAAEEKKAGHQEGKKGVEKELAAIIGLPVLEGEVWQKMTQGEKMSFMWGFGHVVAIEQHLREKYPKFRSDDFIAKVIEGMSGLPMNDVIANIDNYYTAHPDQLSKPVMNVIWDTMIKPNIKKGIAGRPLKRNP